MLTPGGQDVSEGAANRESQAADVRREFQRRAGFQPYERRRGTACRLLAHVERARATNS